MAKARIRRQTAGADEAERAISALMAETQVKFATREK